MLADGVTVRIAQAGEVILVFLRARDATTPSCSDDPRLTAGGRAVVSSDLTGAF